LHTQRNIWIHIFIGMTVLAAALWMEVPPSEVMILILTISLVMVSEMLNTAIEEVVNMVKPQHHPLAALAKNVAAGAVLVAAIGAVLIGVLIFVPRFLI